ncbi:MAG: hypothetical protein AB8C40_10500 [Gammaproteobacteria bacterium]
MKLNIQSISAKLIFIFIMFPFAVFSNQEINFSNEKTINDLISEKTWDCNMIDAYGESVGIYKFNTAKGNKVEGSIKVPHIPACNSSVLKGTLKKNIMKYRAPNGTPCREVNGVLKFSINDAGTIEAIGTYAIGGTHKRGSNVCTMQK